MPDGKNKIIDDKSLVWLDTLADNYSANNQLHNLIESTDTGLWERNIETNVAWWSPKFCQLLGYNYGEIDTSYTYFIDQLVHPDDREVVYNAFQNHLKNQTPYKVEFRMLNKAGAYCWFESSGKAWLDKNGKPVRMIGAITDIDAKKRAEIEFQNSLDLLNDQNKRLQNFAHIVSHNLRSHSGNLQFMVNLYDHEDSVEEQKVIFNNIRSISENLSLTIDHLNEAVKIQTQINKDLKPVDFNSVFKNTLKALKTLIAETKTEISSDFSLCPTIDYVPVYVESIFLNLITNSIKYKHPDRDPKILCRSYKENGDSYLTVEDNGLGIDLQMNGDKVFGMYKTFHNNPDARGIGLFLTRNQIESLGGCIKIESAVNFGTKFTIRLL